MVKYNGQATLKDIALRLGLSVKAVSMGVNGTGRLGKETRQRILDTAREMNYMPNVAARGLVNKRSYLVGVILPYMNTSFFSNIIAGIERVTEEHDISILLGNSNGSLEFERRTFERLFMRKVDGIIVYPREELHDFYIAAGLPMVQVMNYLPGLGDHFVVVDNCAGAKMAVCHLLEQGHRNIGMITHDAESGEIRLRHAGYEAAMREAGITVKSEWLVDMPLPENTTASEKVMQKLLAQAPELTAVFAASDYAALGALRIVLEAGKRIPNEFALIGFDNLEIAAQQVLYPLSTVAQPKEEIGVLAGQLMVDVIGGREAQSSVVDLKLVIRKTG
jgi:DNA-binding LacI/PurR family transcriptional regulator